MIPSIRNKTKDSHPVSDSKSTSRVSNSPHCSSASGGGASGGSNDEVSGGVAGGGVDVDINKDCDGEKQSLEDGPVLSIRGLLARADSQDLEAALVAPVKRIESDQLVQGNWMNAVYHSESNFAVPVPAPDKIASAAGSPTMIPTPNTCAVVDLETPIAAGAGAGASAEAAKSAVTATDLVPLNQNKEGDQDISANMARGGGVLRNRMAVAACKPRTTVRSGPPRELHVGGHNWEKDCISDITGSTYE